MKQVINLFVLLGLLLAVQACSQKPEGLEIKIDLQNGEDGMVYLNHAYVMYEIGSRAEVKRDTAVLKAGKAVFKLDSQDLHWGNLVFQNGQKKWVGNVKLLIADNEQIKITGDFKDLKNVTISGAKSNDTYKMFNDKNRDLLKGLQEMYKEQHTAYRESAENYKELNSKYKAVAKKVYDTITALPDYANNELVAYLVYENLGSMPFDIEYIEKFIHSLNPALADNFYVKSCQERLVKEKRVLPGQPAFDFTLSDLDGKEYKLSDLRGKYVLMEFSASWCGWCKKEIPFLKEVYELTKNEKNFAMFTVNLDDTREKWEKEVEHSKFPWPVIGDLKSFKGEMVTYYDIHGIPKVYLIDPEGRIVRNDLRRERLVNYIKNMYKK